MRFHPRLETILEPVLTPPITAACRLMSWGLRVRAAHRPAPALPYRTASA